MSRDIDKNAKRGQQVESYGADYLNWKNWGNENFGKLRKTDNAYYKSEIHRIGRRLPNNLRVLEVGFGNGSFLKFSKTRGWDISGTEVNEELVKSAKKQGYSVFNSEDLSIFPENTFDLVAAFDVIEHIPQGDLGGFLLEVKRILKNNGHFIARFPNGDSPFGLPNQNGDVTHVTLLGSGKVKYFANKVGMELLFLGGQAEPIFGTNLVHFVHRLIAVPVKRIINVVIRNIFFPKTSVDFCSSNLTLIYKARKQAGRG